MPCNDNWSDDIRLDKKTYSKMKARLDTSTRLLCAVCTIFEKAGKFQVLSSRVPDLASWWKIHKKEDAERRQREIEMRKDEIKDAKRRIRDLKKELKIAEDAIK